MSMFGELMGISILKGAVVVLTATTLFTGGYGFYQKQWANHYQNKYEETKKELDIANLDRLEMLEAFKTGDNQVDIMKKYQDKIIENCKEIIRRDAEEEPK